MPVQVSWADEAQSIVQYDIVGVWDWYEFYPQFERALVLEESVDHRVDVIVNVLHSDGVPANVLTHIKQIANKQPSNLRLSVIVTRNLLFKTLMGAAARLHPGIRRDYRIAPSVEEAREMIREDRLISERQTFRLQY